MIPWHEIDSVFLDMDGTLLDLHFDNHFWREHVPLRYAEKHNIDIATRIPLAEADPVAFRGQYEWNERGGVVHWTHHDPRGEHTPGWLKHEGRTYQ